MQHGFIRCGNCERFFFLLMRLSTFTSRFQQSRIRELRIFFEQEDHRLPSLHQANSESTCTSMYRQVKNMMAKLVEEEANFESLAFLVRVIIIGNSCMRFEDPISALASFLLYSWFSCVFFCAPQCHVQYLLAWKAVSSKMLKSLPLQSGIQITLQSRQG